ncbi:unnamed protein product [Caenorhabditis auriculariae]|uniref:Ribosomal RNA-processing protein 7 C-terminal domain-containing protein n=1 Tax=Caenorhabditis auriculariae TaxID=2777116 RepID=A0A8S1GNK9_9PELO|nr:unnamed protein product [Caenorhabditis auriculariae]
MVKRKLKSSDGKTTAKRKAQEVEIDPEQLRHLRYSFGGKFTCERHLFLKKDVSREATLIVSNIPSYLPEGSVTALISQFVPYPIAESAIQRSSAGSWSQGQLTMNIAFEKARSCPSRLEKLPRQTPSVLKDSISLYERIFPSAEQMEQATAEYMSRYDEIQEDSKREARKRFTEPDEEGWVTVTKGSKKVAKAVKLKKDDIPLLGGIPKGNKKPKKVDLAFYSFQVKQNKLKKANELLRKFEEDKKRVAQLKQARNFRPI